MRITTPYFQLFSALLTEAVQAGLTADFIQKMIEKFREKEFKINAEGTPVGLRWNMHPQFGFPRQPFKVWQRPQTYKDGVITILKDAKDVINDSRIYSWSDGEVYLINVTLTLTAGQTVTVYPLNREKQRIPGKEKQGTGANITIKTPFIYGVEITGSGIVNGIAGLLQSEYVNYPDWQLIQIVGLPFETGEVGGQGYAGSNQGFVTMPTTAKHAAFQRLAIGNLLHLPVPATGDALVPSPVWNAPDPANYLDFLKNASDSLLEMIQKCLENTDDGSFNPNNRQPLFMLQKNIQGIHQQGAASVEDAVVNVPVVASTLLAAATDCYASLALGFGTYDFPGTVARIATNLSQEAPLASFNNGFDYMVTGDYVIRSFENFPFPFMDELTKDFEFAALSDERPAPMPPSQLQSIGLNLNRPMVWDGAASENIKLRWPKPLLPQGYGILASYKDNTCQVLNSAYSFQADAFPAFNTFVPADLSLVDDPDDTDRFILVHPDEPVPFQGFEMHKYFVAGLDIFGRWSAFVKSTHNAIALPAQKPAITLVTMVPPVNPPAVDPTLTVTLEIEIAWNWKDRSVDTIEIAGQFYTPGSGPSGLLSDTPPGIFSLHSANSLNDTIKITFGDRGLLNPEDVLPSASQGSIAVKISPPSDPPTTEARDLIKYILTVPNVTAIFPPGEPYEVAYAVYARALEKVRKLPAEDWGPWLEHPVVTRMNDPRPPLAVTLPATIQFTAVPDATKLGRGKLSWAAAGGALGYNVWEANETALRAVLGPLLLERFPTDETLQILPLTAGLQNRATQLRDLLAQSDINDLCAKSFSRLNKKLLTDTSIELELPGSTDILFVFKVSSANSANIESGKSNAVFFAVPRVVKPPSPSLTVRKYKDPVNPAVKGFEVQVLNGNGQVPAGFKLFRNRKIIISNDVGMKGLPYKQSDAADWQPYQTALRDEPAKILEGKKLVDIILERSWKPYCYQAIAVGAADTPNGLLSGESGGSTTQIVYLPPDSPPILLQVPPLLGNSFSFVIVCTTNLPFDQLSLGFAMIELLQVSTDATGKFVKQLIKNWKAFDVPVAAADLLPATAAAEAAVPKISRMAADNTGTTRFSVMFSVAISKGIIRVTDPLSRATEILFG